MRPASCSPASLQLHSSTHFEQTQFGAVGDRLGDEVVGPRLVLVPGVEADAKTIVQPEPASLRLPRLDLQPLAPARCTARAWRSLHTRTSAGRRWAVVIASEAARHAVTAAVEASSSVRS